MFISSLTRSRCFNPRARTGRDLFCRSYCDINYLVSIHAPARGATAEYLFPQRGLASFNPRARTGRDEHGNITIPEEECFNPRARTGRDLIRLSPSRASSVSIHAPARGATNKSVSLALYQKSFNPRARTGRDLFLYLSIVFPSMFQSTRPHGARRFPAGASV